MALAANLAFATAGATGGTSLRAMYDGEIVEASRPVSRSGAHSQTAP
jgi:hypothetical protein